MKSAIFLDFFKTNYGNLCLSFGEIVQLLVQKCSIQTTKCDNSFSIKIIILESDLVLKYNTKYILENKIVFISDKSNWKK